ncbi:MAG: hypothetical protein RR313_07695 [Anaerovoracaceae bacterium]
MTIFVACLLVGVSTVALVVLWFWVVRRELLEKQKIVEISKSQLVTSKQEYMRVRGEPSENKVREILDRSQSVYDQSVEIYNKILRKPWNMIPAFFLDLRPVKEKNKN